MIDQPALLQSAISEYDSTVNSASEKVDAEELILNNWHEPCARITTGRTVVLAQLSVLPMSTALSCCETPWLLPSSSTKRTVILNSDIRSSTGFAIWVSH